MVSLPACKRWCAAALAPDGILVQDGCDGGDLGDQTDCREAPLPCVVDVGTVRIEGREGAHHTHHDGHRVRIRLEALEEGDQPLMHHPMQLQLGLEFVQLAYGGQLTLDQQVGDLGKGAAFGEVTDAIAAVQQDPGVAVDEGDRTHTARSGGEARVICAGAGRGRVKMHGDAMVMG